MRPALLLLCGLLLTLASASACGCAARKAAPTTTTTNTLNEQQNIRCRQFSLSALDELARVRADAALGQNSGDEMRAYTHEVFTDSSGQAKTTTRRQLGQRVVSEEKVAGRITRNFQNMKESDLSKFDLEWAGQPSGYAPNQKRQPKIEHIACAKQRHPDGAAVEVMLLGPGERESNEWGPARVKSMSCEGTYELVTPDGDPVIPALPTGIQDKHLRRVSVDESKALLQRRLEAAEKAVQEARQAVAAEKAAKKSDAMKHAKEQSAKRRVAQIDAALKEAERAYSEGRQQLEAELRAAAQEEIALQ